MPIFQPSSTHSCEWSRAPGVPESPGVLQLPGASLSGTACKLTREVVWTHRMTCRQPSSENNNTPQKPPSPHSLSPSHHHHHQSIFLLSTVPCTVQGKLQRMDAMSAADRVALPGGGANARATDTRLLVKVALAVALHHVGAICVLELFDDVTVPRLWK